MKLKECDCAFTSSFLPPFHHNLHHPFPSIITASRANTNDITPTWVFAILPHPFLHHLLLLLHRLLRNTIVADHVAFTKAIEVTTSLIVEYLLPCYLHFHHHPFGLLHSSPLALGFCVDCSYHPCIATVVGFATNCFDTAPIDEVIIAITASSTLIAFHYIVAIHHFIIVAASNMHFTFSCIVVVEVQYSFGYFLVALFFQLFLVSFSFDQRFSNSLGFCWGCRRACLHLCHWKQFDFSYDQCWYISN